MRSRASPCPSPRRPPPRTATPTAPPNRTPHRVASRRYAPLPQGRSSTLRKPVLNLIGTLRIPRSRGPLTHFALDVVPGIQSLASSPVPQLVPEIQLPLHAPTSSFVYFISRQYGIQRFWRR